MSQQRQQFVGSAPEPQSVVSACLRFLADTLNSQVDRPEIFGTTGLGAGYLTGWQAGRLDPHPQWLAKTRRRQMSFMPSMAPGERESHCLRPEI